MRNRRKRCSYGAIVALLVLPVSSALGAYIKPDSRARAVRHGQHHHTARHKPGAIVHPSKSHSVASAAPVLLGDTSVEWQYDSLTAGEAEAFRLRASSSGVADAVHVFISANSSAGTLIAGLYGSSAGQPGALLSTGSTSVAASGTWSTVSLAPVELVAGKSYWLAILGEGGRLRYRDRPSGPCPSDTSASRDLRALPGTWRTGASYMDCPISAYVTTQASSRLPSALTEPLALTQEAQALAAAPLASEAPSVSGELAEGKALTASNGAWSGSPSSYTYQWEVCNAAGESCSNIAGATSASYKLTSSDVGHTLRVVVTASNSAGSTKASSAATAMVQPTAPADTVLPLVSGSAVEGQTLSASAGSWEGTPPLSYSYQWDDCNTSGNACSNISGATHDTHKLTSSDVGHTLRVVVTASNSSGSTNAFSAATATVLAAQAPSNTKAPEIAGAPDEGQTLSSSTGSWDGTAPLSYSYQWQDCNASGEACSNISGATSATYKLTSSDVGHRIRVVVTASNSAGSTKASSAATSTVLVQEPPSDTKAPEISGADEEGQTLSATQGTWTNNPTSYAYQWEDCNTAGESCSNISGATSTSYKLTSSDVGHTVRVVVTATNAGGSAKASSAATAKVSAEQPPSNTKAPEISGADEEGQTLSATQGTWTNNPTSYAYQWEDCNTAGESCSNISGATSSSYKLVSGDVGHRVRVAVTASNAGGSTKASSAASATVVVASVGSGSQIYVAQNGAGSQSGEGSCSNAHPLSWLNRESDWGSGAGKVAPGTTVDLCGTFTEPVETKGSGSSGKPVTILFTAGAKIAKGGAGCPGSGCLNIANESAYITIDGGSDGVIENTDSGTGKESPSTTTGILANGCKHCAIENLEIANLYVAKKGDEKDNTEIRGIFIREGSPEYVTVSHDVFHDMGWAVNIEASESTSHIYVEHDTFYHLTHGFTPTAAFNGGNIGPVVFAHNHWYGNLNWEDGNPSNGTGPDTNHSDGVHCYSADGRGYTPHYNGLYIYDNYVEMEGEDNTAPIFLEGGSGDGSTPCADKTSNIWVYDNVFSSTDTELGDGLLGAYSGEPHIYNNTLIGSGRGQCEVINDHVAAEMRFKDNVVTSCPMLIEAEKERLAANGMEYNLWANAGSSNEAFICLNPDEHHYDLVELLGWESCVGDAHSITTSNAKLDLQETVGAQGKPEAGSPALDAGANLTSLCPSTPEEALCKNINGEARPSTGAWDIGAY